VIVKKFPDSFDSQFDIIYYSTDEKFSRVAYYDGKYTIEFTGVMTDDQFKQNYPGVEYESITVYPYGRVFESENTPPENIRFSGRFAEWKYKLTVEHIIKQAIEN
jgi:hypothetical protein